MIATLPIGVVPPVSYEENYDAIAQTHLGSLRSGKGNPWMLADDITLFAKVSSKLVKKYTPKGGKVLDAGCGPAELELELDCKRFQVTGLDISADYIAYAKERVPGAHFQQGLLERIPFESKSFDTVVCVDVLEHVLYLDDVVRELLRVLKPGGHVIVRVPVEDSVGAYIVPNPFWFVHMRRFDEPELVLLFTRAYGCEVLEVSLCPRANNQLPNEIHCVARKP